MKIEGGTKSDLVGGNQKRGSSPPKKVLINREMVYKKSDYTYEECVEVVVSPAQKEVFFVIDEWWKKYGFSPTIRDIAYVRGKMGLGNTKKIVDRLVKLGVIKKLDKAGRTIRPVYINFKNLQ
jgi:hypothetical protein